jgi:CDGSH-type Zn-finger protein
MSDDTSNPSQPIAEFTFKTGASLKVKGNFILKDSQGNIIPTGDSIKLCRCGKSKNQPFCDHSHRNE